MNLLQLTLTLSGQDRLGNALGTGLAPSTWSFSTVDEGPGTDFYIYLPLAIHKR
jgi:hypothetical protein